ncbi:sugar phosphate isomerase/epimerase [Halobacillus shinanisalinarum]|uniref:Sugar phosphate isomerase/epimerase n=1 Tax=Halobacillus shinanisalinarum TaxID=2932258 RepID=A0ABY4H0X6_9BACI|nr:TIM barrel protein [Halobacillus shinanisalinarum]UOQ93828.1 sugar phosphate isomerase/epimerase [Halobacillus shinanisalinarum]
MAHQLGLSGSTIMSDPDKFEQLFKRRFSHVEIGEFPSLADFEDFLRLAEAKEYSYGVHSPLIRGESKYDLISFISFDPRRAREQFEDEVRKLTQLGATYVLVHFPYFKAPDQVQRAEKIDEGLQFLSQLQQTYDIPIVCEPKLGPSMSPHNIEALHHFSKQTWETYALSLCIDIGDYLLAVGGDWQVYLEHLKPYIKVVHLHNILIEGSKYIWVPPHPDLEGAEGYWKIKPIVQYLAQGTDKYFLFEHTPHSNPTDEFVDEGIDWIHELICTSNEEMK